MKFQHRRSHEVEEGESYYVSMTDMMVGVVFIFIIMLSYFALQFKTTTATLTQAKDAQTAALLQTVGKMDSENVTLDIDRQNHIVCLPGTALQDDTGSRHCFAYTSAAMPASGDASADAAQADLIASIGSDLMAEQINASTDKGGLTFTGDQLFESGTATLSANGQDTISKVAKTLADKLPCFSVGVKAAGDCPAGAAKVQSVLVGAHASVDPDTPAGRAAADLTLQRSAVFYDTLMRSDPRLSQLRAAQGSGGLLHVSSSVTQASGPPTPVIIAIQFHMAH